MAKKEKSKKRLDKFYHIAKEQGFRSRAAYKLIQLNKKYNFLSTSNVLIDLCAAPGGWMQVASKYMPSNSIILGIDLDPIKPVPNCKSFQEDITTPKCVALIRRELKTMKADVVLNDGAPNVGADWTRDAFVQSELVLASLKLACEVLRKGGWFVTKVFRSADYHSLIWVMSKFFDKVEATKPEASRAISAEIFVVGIGYKAPDYIDKKFFDPGQVFKENEANLAEWLRTKEVNSVDKVFEIRNRKRRTQLDGDTQTLSKKITLEQFIDTESAYAVFVDCTAIEITPKDREKYLSVVKPPAELEEWCKDLLLLGKREITNLVKWRGKVRDATKKASRAKFDKIEYGAHDDDEEEEVNPEDELYKIEKKERKAQEKLKEKKMLNFVKQNQVTGVNVAESEFAQEVGNFDFNKYGDLMRKGEVYTDFKAEEEADDERLKKLGGRYHEYTKKEVKPYSEEEVMDNLEFLYEQKRMRKEASEAKHRERQLEKEKRKLRFLGENMDEEEDQAEEALKMNRLDDKEVFLRKRALDETADRVEVSDLKRSKWFDRDIFQVMEPAKKQIVQLPENYSEDEDAEEDGDQEDMEGEEEFYDDEEGIEEGDEEEDMDEEDLEGLEEDVEDDVEGLEEEDEDDGEEEEGEEEFEDEEMDEEEAESEEAGEFDDLKELKPLRTYQNGNSKKNVQDDIDDAVDEALKSKAKKVKKAPAKEERELHTLYDDAEYEIFAGDADEDEMLRDMHSSQVSKKDMKRQNRIKAFEKMEREEKAGVKEQPMEEEYIEELDDEHLTELTPSQKKLLDKKNKKEIKAFRGQVNDKTIQVVPAKKFEDYDTDELAADLALAKKMIRKKDREEILDMSFNKYNNFEYDDLPNWFVEDEKRHNYLNLPITKDEVREMREELKTMSEKPAKKVLEARFRRKRKLERQLRKFKKEADQVFEEEGMDERGKAREVSKMRSKIVTADKAKRHKKKVIVGKKFKISAPGKKTTGKKYKIVDKRSKKELRAEKRQKRQGKGGKSRSRKGKR